jgi:hypothetical protein
MTPLALNPTFKLEIVFVGCLLPIIQFIQNCTQYLEAISYAQKHPMHHSVVTRDPPNMESYKPN